MGEAISVVVVVLTACPVGLRGDLTRWLLEVSPGVFVGNVSARVRDGLWARILAMVRNGRAIMVYSAKTDGATMLGVPQKGWSNASKYRSARRFGR